jgi:uncharacterized protein (TIGR00106 family)
LPYVFPCVLGILIMTFYNIIKDGNYIMSENVIAEVSIVPVGTGDCSLSKYVAGCLSAIEASTDVKFQLTPMGTVIEGPLDSVLAAIKLMHEVPFKKGVKRVVTTIKLDDRRDIEASMNRKVDSVLNKTQDRGKRG